MDTPEPLWLRILGWLAGLIGDQSRKRALVDAGATPEQADSVKFFSVPLGSGYSVEGERAMDAEKLRALGEAIILKWPPKAEKDGTLTTYCNRAVQDVAATYGCEGLNGMMANDMAQALGGGLVPGWTRAMGDMAAKHARRGGLALAAKEYTGHGHVAILAPESMQFSGSWGHDVPVLYNVGKKNGLMKCSEAFAVAQGEPAYYIYGETA